MKTPIEAALKDADFLFDKEDEAMAYLKAVSQLYLGAFSLSMSRNAETVKERQKFHSLSADLAPYLWPKIENLPSRHKYDQVIIHLFADGRIYNECWWTGERWVCPDINGPEYLTTVVNPTHWFQLIPSDYDDSLPYHVPVTHPKIKEDDNGSFN